MTKLPLVLSKSLETGTCLSLILSRKRHRPDGLPEKLTVRPLVVRGEGRFQLTQRVSGKETHENLTPTETIETIQELFGAQFQHAHLFTTEADYSARVKADGTVMLKKSPPSKTATDAARSGAREMPSRAPSFPLVGRHLCDGATTYNARR